MQTRNFFRLSALLVVASTLAACQPGQQISPNVRNAAIGAGAGAVAAKAFDGNATKGALAGAALGALCNDAGVCSGY
ncbi:YMGG-like glycine zipper-containing protein [Paracoccus sp. (in: a-proteobacteria)]|uniref:YMGG-like glycine zipper-containing protein n=1 Tax=Paracoccus sp. TaxID=267 RepID=UPI0028A1C40C|nr:YMGG-like glycine zipper-containing protein [Paracoccus sp. (in: a-proteobacteria)]